MVGRIGERETTNEQNFFVLLRIRMAAVVIVSRGRGGDACYAKLINL